MALTDYLPGGDDERFRLAKMRQLDYKEGGEQPLEVRRAEDEPVEMQPMVVKPPTMPLEDWKTALTVFPPERVKEIYGQFDPEDVRPFFQNVYESVFKKPEEPDEKKMAASRNMAGIGDALSLIAQSIAAANDSFIEKRDPAKSATAQTDANTERLRDLYRKERANYDAGYWGAQMKDYDGAKGDFARDRAALLALLAKRRDDANRDKRFNGEMVYKYEKMGGDDADKKARLKLQAEGNAIKRAQLAWQKEKSKIPGKETPKGFMDFYDSETGMTYRVAEKKWKANYTQIFNRIKGELFKSYPLLQSQDRLGSLKPSDKEEYVKQYMYDNPTSMKFLENIADTKFQDGQPEPVAELPSVSQEQYDVISGIAKKNRKDETKAIQEIAVYLKGEGFKQEEIVTLLKAMQE